MSDILDRLVVHADRMLENIEFTRGLIYSQPVMLALVDAGMDRQAAYKLVQRHAQNALTHEASFEEGLFTDPSVAERISRDELRSLFNPRSQLEHVQTIFRRIGLEGGTPARGRSG
jgi:adenylosuccinate lyase